MSNKSKTIFDKHWAKMDKFITAISDSIKEYYRVNTGSSLPDDEIMLISLQVFILVCGNKFNFSPDKMNAIWDTSKGIHKLIQQATDSSDKSDLQKYAYSNEKQLKN